MSVTTLALDTFTAADTTELVGHHADQSFGTWAGFAGVWKIMSNKAAAFAALSNYNHSGSTVPNDKVTYVAEISRANSTAADNLGGVRMLIRSNAGNKGGTHESLYLSTMGATVAGTALIKVGRQAGASQVDVSTLTTMSWVTDQTFRWGVYVDGSVLSVWHEDSDGSSHVDYAPLSFVTSDYSDNFNFSMDGDLSTSEKTWYVDNLAIYNSYYTGLASQGGGGGGGGGGGTVVGPYAVSAFAVAPPTVGPVPTRGG